jgi:hypothetical protein
MSGVGGGTPGGAPPGVPPPAAAPSPPPASHPLEPSSSHPVAEVFENQRFYGAAWGPPLAVLDAPAWADAAGAPVELEGPPPGAADAGTEGADWVAVVDDATDAAGWLYGTVFSHLSAARPGGRAARRLSDAVRARRWRRAGGGAAGRAPDGGAAEAAAGAERSRVAVRLFLDLVVGALSRTTTPWVGPWDLAGLFPVLAQHAAALACLRAAAAAAPLLGGGAEGPPSPLRAGGTLLQDLLVAARHSRASYGYAMQVRVVCAGRMRAS